MLYRFAPLLIALGLPLEVMPPAAAQAPTAIPSKLIKVVEFDDRGRVYRVDIDSGAVTFVESADVKPIPPTPTPKPPPIPPAPVVAGKAKWLTLLVAPYDVDQRSWIDDETIRAKTAAAGVNFRSFDSTEEDVDSLGFRPFAKQNSIPCVIVQDATGKVILSRKVTSPDDVVNALMEANK